MDLSSQMVLYARVVDRQSFSGAARELGQTPSAVSRQIAQLEDRIGVKLLHRSTSGLAVTAEGSAFYERCVDVVARIADAETFAATMKNAPQGRLKIAATVAFAKSQLLPVMPNFLERYADLSVELELTDRPVDFAHDRIDVAIRFTEQLDEDRVIARKIAANRRVICAAPDYLERHGTPQTSADLVDHNCLQLSTVSRWNEWHLPTVEGQPPVALTGNFCASSADGIYHATLAGLGLSRLSLYLVGADLAAGRLVRVLPDYVDEGSDIVAIYADRRHLAPKIRAFIDYLLECFGNAPAWERQSNALPAMTLAG